MQKAIKEAHTGFAKFVAVAMQSEHCYKSKVRVNQNNYGHVPQNFLRSWRACATAFRRHKLRVHA